MKNTLAYIEATKQKLGIESDYALAKKLDLTRFAISSYRTGRRVIDDYTAMKIAEALGEDPLKLIALANYEREKEKGRKEFWRKIAGVSASAVLLFNASHLSSLQTQETHEQDEQCILCKTSERDHGHPRSAQSDGPETPSSR